MGLVYPDAEIMVLPKKRNGDSHFGLPSLFSFINYHLETVIFLAVVLDMYLYMYVFAPVPCQIKVKGLL